MPANKKPRKPYRPKAVLKPLGVKDGRKLEMPGRVGLIAIGTGWLDINHIIDIGCHAALVVRVARDVGDQDAGDVASQAVKICETCHDRFERTGKAGVTGDELRMLREIVPATMAWIAQQPNQRIYDASQALLKILDRWSIYNSKNQAVQ